MYIDDDDDERGHVAASCLLVREMDRSNSKTTMHRGNS
jgi:hypothetical protein